MRNMTYRIYGKVLERWTITDDAGRERLRQEEIAYKEYNESGELIGVGSADFSLERKKRELVHKFVYIWDGKRRNKGGYRWFECVGSVIYTRNDATAVKEHFKRIYNAETVELR